MRGVMFAALLALGACAAGPVRYHLPPSEAARLVVASGVTVDRYSVDESMVMGPDGSWLIHIYQAPREIQGLCFTPHTTLVIWKGDAGYVVHEKVETFAMQMHGCRGTDLTDAIDVRGGIDAENAVALLDRIAAIAQTGGASEPQAKFTYEYGIRPGFLSQIERSRVYALGRAPDGSVTACFSDGAGGEGMCFELEFVGSTLVRIAFSRSHQLESAVPR